MGGDGNFLRRGTHAASLPNKKNQNQAKKRPTPPTPTPTPVAPWASVSAALASLYQRRRCHFCFLCGRPPPQGPFTVKHPPHPPQTAPTPSSATQTNLCVFVSPSDKKREREKKRKEKTAKVKSAQSTSRWSGAPPLRPPRPPRRRPPTRPVRPTRCLARFCSPCRSASPLVTSPRP